MQPQPHGAQHGTAGLTGVSGRFAVLCWQRSMCISFVSAKGCQKTLITREGGGGGEKSGKQIYSVLKDPKRFFSKYEG